MLTWAKLFQTVQYDLMKLFIQFIHKKKKDLLVNWTSLNVTGESQVLSYALYNYKPKV